MMLSLVKTRHLSQEGYSSAVRSRAEFGTKLAKPMSDTDSIDEFLAGTLRAVRAQSPVPWALGSDASWKQVWARIEYHGIAFLLNSHAQRLRGWPTDLLSRVREEARLIALWETTHLKAVSEVIETLDEAGVETVLMKGTALAYSLHEEPAARRRGDTDLLIHPEDLTQTRKILQSLGWYRKEDPHGLYSQEGWLHDAAGFFVHAIDLHWEPSDRPVLQEMLPLKAFYADRRPVPRLHKAARRPDPGLMILHATINQKWHALHGYDSESGRLTSPRRLIWSVDLDLLCQSMEQSDWAWLEAHCAAHGVGSLVAEALEGMQQDLGNQIPVNSLAALRANLFDKTLSDYFANPDSLTQFWIDLKMANSLKKKSNLIKTRAFPPREHLLEKYPSASRWPTALLQARLLIETAGRAVRKATSR